MKVNIHTTLDIELVQQIKEKRLNYSELMRYGLKYVDMRYDIVDMSTKIEILSKRLESLSQAISKKGFDFDFETLELVERK